MFESITRDPDGRAYRALLFRQKIRSMTTIQRRVPNWAFVLTTSATPAETTAALASLRRWPLITIAGRVVPSVAGSNLYVSVSVSWLWILAVVALLFLGHFVISAVVFIAIVVIGGLAARHVIRQLAERLPAQI